MRQQSSESNDHYVERFNANVQTLNLAKGGHFFCSRALVQCEDDDITETEKYNEEQKLKAAILLKRSDEGRYKKLLGYLKDRAHLGRDEYPTSVASTFDLLNRMSG